MQFELDVRAENKKEGNVGFGGFIKRNHKESRGHLIQRLKNGKIKNKNIILGFSF